MIYTFDIDGTICLTNGNDYINSTPLTERINIINNLYEQGHIIKIFTARGMTTKNGNIKEVYKDYYDMTLSQLSEWGLKFHELILGKPSSDFYIDDKGISDVNFF